MVYLQGPFLFCQPKTKPYMPNETLYAVCNTLVSRGRKLGCSGELWIWPLKFQLFWLYFYYFPKGMVPIAFVFEN